MRTPLQEIQKRVDTMTQPDDQARWAVAIVEDDPEIRAGWRAIVNRMPGYRCTADFGSAEAALAELPTRPPDIVLMDIQLPRMSGIDCTRELTRLLPKVEVIMLTMFGDRDNLFSALQAGAAGYLLKRTSPSALKEALDQARNGGAPMSPQIARQVVEFFRKPTTASETAAARQLERLSAREAEVLRLLAAGQSYKLIAAQLELTLDTIRTYIRRIYQKLHVNSRTEAIVRYLSADATREP